MDANQYYHTLKQIDIGLTSLVVSTLLMFGSVILLTQTVPSVHRLKRLLNFWPPVLVGRGLLQSSMLLSINRVYLIAVALRLPSMRGSFWYDETFTGVISRLSFNDMWTVINADVHPPLYYSLTWLIARINSSEVALRLPSLIAGLISIWLVYRIARHVFGPRAAIWAALLVAIMPAHIHYSAEARVYTIFLCVVLAALLNLLEQRRWHFALMCCLLPLLHTHGYLMAFLLGIYALATFRRASLLPLALASLPGLAWLPVVINQTSHVVDGFWIRPLTIANLPWWLFRPIFNTFELSEPGIYVLMVYATFIVLVIIALGSCRMPGAWWLVVGGFPVAIAVISWLVAPIYIYRSMLATGVLLSLPLGWSARRWYLFRAALIGCLIPAALVTSLTEQRMNVRSVIAACSGADAIYTVSTSTAIMASYYAPNIPQYIYHRSNDLSQALTDDAKHALGWTITEPTNQTICIPFALAPHTNADQQQELSRIAAGMSGELLIQYQFFEFWVYRNG